MVRPLADGLRIFRRTGTADAYSVDDEMRTIDDLLSMKDDSDLVTNSVLYKEFLSEREEILRHKWIESEKAGQDIGFEKALLDWIVNYRSDWRAKRIASQRAENGDDK